MPILQTSYLDGWESYGDIPEQIIYNSFSSDSRIMNSGDLFFGYDGLSRSVLDYLDSVLEKRPAAVFLENSHADSIRGKYPGTKIPFFFKPDFRKASHQFIAHRMDYPFLKMRMLAVTGTNGKTSLAWYDYQMREKSVYIGTIGMFRDDTVDDSGMTTPDFLRVMQFLEKSAGEGAQSVSMEVSSHALDQDRLWGLEWDYLVFTNLTQDHLDYHSDMEQYFHAKLKLFANALTQKGKKPVFIINADDEYGKRIMDIFRNSGVKILSYGKKENSHFQIMNIQVAMDGYSFDLKISGEKSGIFPVNLPLIGEFNIYNILPVMVAGFHSGESMETLVEKVRNIRPAPGRMEKIPIGKNRLAVVDYAHTPDALRKGLITLRELNPSRLVCVFGAGGDRDRKKRPLMGQAVDELSDYGIITSDNPRTENPLAIMEDVRSGFLDSSRYEMIEDRKSAIRKGLSILPENGILYIAGKGHENYQIIGKEKIYFCDPEVVKESIQEKL